MMNRTDRHFRRLLRMISKRAMLYTEMIAAQAVLFGDRRRLAFEALQRPLGLQVGGSDPDEMRRCADVAEALGYDEINVNVGCPSSRVRMGAFGACLMLSPQRVADCVATASAKHAIPVTVKCRIGVETGRREEQEDDGRTLAELCRFVEIVADAGCRTFIVHARKAVLGGLSPKQNREIPTLRYDLVRVLKREFPQTEIILNGGLRTLYQAKSEAEGVDGVMLGRAVYRNPMLLAEVDTVFYREKPRRISRREVAEGYLDYLQRETERGVPASLMTRHLVNWFHGQPGARRWRRYLSDELPKRTERGELSKPGPDLALQLAALNPS